MIRLLIPSKGTLKNESLKILELLGIEVPSKDRSLIYYNKKLDLEIVYMDHFDIAKYTALGYADFGITGRDLMYNVQHRPNEIIGLKFAHSMFKFIVKNGSEINSIHDFNGKRIVTPYIILIENFLKKHNIDAKVDSYRGAIEASIHLGIADIIADVVNTEMTLRDNDLHTIDEPVIVSEAILVSGKEICNMNQEQIDFVKRIEKVVLSRKYVKIQLINVDKNVYKKLRDTYELEKTTILDYSKGLITTECYIYDVYLEKLLKNEETININIL